MGKNIKISTSNADTHIRCARVYRYIAAAIAFWTFVTICSLLWNTYNERRQTLLLVRNIARSNFDKDQAFRLWAASHGGVYVPVDEKTAPNPFLAHIPQRDIEGPSGKPLTLMNPAWAMRQMMEQFSELYGIKGHITSIKHFRPETAPDEWERAALTSFEQGSEEVTEVSLIGGEPHMRLMRPMITRQDCLKCHGHQGYKVGDVRGGVSLSVPMSPYLAIEKRNIDVIRITHLLFYLTGIGAIGLMGWKARNRYIERFLAHEELRKYRDHLEELVKERTLELSRANEQLHREVGERKQREQEIEQLNSELSNKVIQLEDANREMEAFSYSISHDLRAPLRAIDGFSGLLLMKRGDSLDAEGKRLLGVVRQKTERMNQLIDDLLSFSRMGRRKMITDRIDMDKLAISAFEELKVSIPGRTIDVISTPLPPAQGDRSMIYQVFMNLLSNSIKFTQKRDDAVIEIGARREGNENIYHIRDNGAGFDMKYADRLFGAFQRLHSEDEFEGTGVGLALVQRIIHRHGGRVWAEGKVNEGAAFYFTLPVIK